MKNIFILPTDKPSRLFYNVGGALLFTSFPNYNGVNIYITSWEKIELVDWILYNDKYVRKVANTFNKQDMDWNAFNTNKIILTTDKLLIDDGIEPLTDEFLTWFIKNQDCTDYSDFKNK